MKNKILFLLLIVLLLILGGCKEQKFHTKTQLFAVNNTSDTFLVKFINKYTSYNINDATNTTFDKSNIKDFTLNANDSILLNDTVRISYLPMSTMEYTNYTLCIYSKKDSTYFYSDWYDSFVAKNDSTNKDRSYCYYYYDNEPKDKTFTQINQVFLIDSVMLSQMKKDTALTNKLFNLK